MPDCSSRTSRRTRVVGASRISASSAARTAKWRVDPEACPSDVSVVIGLPQVAVNADDDGQATLKFVLTRRASSSRRALWAGCGGLTWHAAYVTL